MAQDNLHTLKNFGRIDFKPEEFDRAVFQRGARAIWEKSMLCSCIDVHSGQPDFGCTVCFGKGFVYFDPTEIRAIAQGIGGDNQNIPIGLIDVGTSYLTVRSMDRVNFRDRITFPDMVTTYSQVLTYSGDGEPVELKYTAKELLAVRVLEYELPPETYSLSDGGRSITFSTGVMNYGDRFSVLLRISPVYIVIDMPHDLRGSFIKFGRPDEEWVELPKQLIIKREDLLPLKRGEIM